MFTNALPDHARGSAVPYPEAHVFSRAAAAPSDATSTMAACHSRSASSAKTRPPKRFPAAARWTYPNTSKRSAVFNLATPPPWISETLQPARQNAAWDRQQRSSAIVYAGRAQRILTSSTSRCWRVRRRATRASSAPAARPTRAAWPPAALLRLGCTGGQRQRRRHLFPSPTPRAPSADGEARGPTKLGRDLEGPTDGCAQPTERKRSGGGATRNLQSSGDIISGGLSRWPMPPATA